MLLRNTDSSELISVINAERRDNDNARYSCTVVSLIFVVSALFSTVSFLNYLLTKHVTFDQDNLTIAAEIYGTGLCETVA